MEDVNWHNLNSTWHNAQDLGTKLKNNILPHAIFNIPENAHDIRVFITIAGNKYKPFNLPKDTCAQLQRISIYANVPTKKSSVTKYSAYARLTFKDKNKEPIDKKLTKM